MDNHFLIVPPGWKGEVPPWINRSWEAPTNHLTAYNRVFVKADDSDIKEVREWRSGFHFTQLSKWGEENRGMPFIDVSRYVHENLRTLKDPFEYFSLVFDFIAENPSGPDDEGLVQLFKTAGIGAGVSFPNEPHLRSAIIRAVKDAQDILNAAISGGELHDGWKIPNQNVGKAGPFILDRAVMQLKQIGSNIPQESTYIFAYEDSDGEVLDGSKSNYSLTFGRDELPPVKHPGFWSLTMYKKSDSLLVGNPIDAIFCEPIRQVLSLI